MRGLWVLCLLIGGCASAAITNQAKQSVAVQAGCSSEEVHVREVSSGVNDARLYTMVAQDKTYSVRCESGACTAVLKVSSGPSYGAPSQSAPSSGAPSYSGPKCTKGCPCGNACIDCSKVCHK